MPTNDIILDTRPFILIIQYVDGMKKRKTFSTYEDALWYARNEGDHVMQFSIEREHYDN